MKKIQDHEHAPLLTTEETRVYGFCQEWHGPKRIATFCEEGLLSWCKFCKRERLISWQQLDDIRRSFAQREQQKRA